MGYRAFAVEKIRTPLGKCKASLFPLALEDEIAYDELTDPVAPGNCHVKGFLP